MKSLFIWSSCLLMTMLSGIEAQEGEALNAGVTSCEEMNPCKKKRAHCFDDQNACCPVPLCELQKTCLGFSASGEFLYWKAATNDLPCATTGVIAVIPGITTYITDNSVKSVNFSYDPGFRVGLGYQFDKGWSFDVDWTRFHSGASRSFETARDLTSSDLIQSIWAFFPGKIVSLTGHQFVKFDEVDFIFSKNIKAGTHFIFNPYLGPLYAKINQELEIDQEMLYSNGYANQQTHIHNYYTGAGLKLGFNAEWAPFNCVSLYGNGNYALVYGQFQLKRKDLVTGDVGGATLQAPNNEFSHEKAVTSAFNIDVGLKGKWSFSDGRFELVAQIGYEFLLWLDQIRIRRILTGDTVQSYLLLGNGDLGMQGLTTGLELRF